MASIRKRGNSYLIVVSMGYDYEGNRIKPVQKTIKPPAGLTPRQTEKWLDEQALLFEMEVKHTPQAVNANITLAEYTEIWLRDVAPSKLAKSTLVRDTQDIRRILPHLGHYKLKELRPEIFRAYYDKMRKDPRLTDGKPISEHTVEGLHACLCSILSDAMAAGYITHNPAWRTYRYKGRKKEAKIIADEEMVQKLLVALEDESIKYETYFKLIIATGMRRGECCGLKWSDIDCNEKSIHIQRSVVKLSGEPIFTKEPKTTAGNRRVYLSGELCSLLKEYRRECEEHAGVYDGKTLTEEDFLFRQPTGEPMTPSSFTWRFKLILKKNGLPEKLNVHSLRHTNASLMIANGVDVTTAAGLLGHSQPSTTLDIYSHAFDSKKKAAQEQLWERLEI